MATAFTVQSLYDENEHRLYMNDEERQRFARATLRFDAPTRTFGRVLLFSGARLSEALALRRCDVQMHEYPRLRFQTLKRRREHERVVPVPRELGTSLADVFDLGPKAKRGGVEPLWTWSRQTGWSKIKQIMAAAEIEGPQASPKGLRHSFAVAAVLSEPMVPPTQLQTWMGHASIETTAVYYQLVGREDWKVAERMWGGLR